MKILDVLTEMAYLAIHMKNPDLITLHYPEPVYTQIEKEIENSIDYVIYREKLRENTIRLEIGGTTIEIVKD